MKASEYLFAFAGALRVFGRRQGPCLCVLSALLAWMAGTVTLAQATNPIPVRTGVQLADADFPGLDVRLSLDVIAKDQMDIGDLLRFFAVKGKLNLVVGREVTGIATKVLLKDVSLRDAMEIILAANNLAYEIRGNIIKVMTDKEYRELHGESFYEQRKVKVIELKYASPGKVAPLLAEVKSTIGKIVSDDLTGTLVLVDTPEKIQAMEAVILRAELPTVERQLPTETRSIALQYATPEDLQADITSMLTKDVGKLRSDKRTKTLVLTDLPQNLAKIEDMIAIFDRPARQVFIEAKIVQVELNNAFSLGVRWTQIANYIQPRFSLEALSQFPLGLGANDPQGTLTYKAVTPGGELDAVLNALETMGSVKLLSNPHIAVVDGQKATIEAVTEQPYAELKYESGSTNITGKTYTFIPVGVSLSVEPRINDEGFIRVTLKPEVSSITAWYDSAGAQSGVPVVRKSHAETTVTVKDGVTIIIAGMIEEDETETTTGLPFLSRIPFLGFLFRSQGKTKMNSETIVFLTPKIVTGAEPYLRSKDLKQQKKGGNLSLR